MPDDITPRTSQTSNEDLIRRLTQDRYPRSNSYDVRWVIENQMGPNALWLLEWLAPALGLDTLRPCARVLDLGCGRAMTSVFLAREYDVQVTAADLWVKPDDNAKRIAEAGFADRVLPVHAEAHDLPFAEGSFDAIVSIDAYQYFGTNDLYLPTLTRLLKPGGRIGVVVPAAAGGAGRHRAAGAPQAVVGARLLVLPHRRLVAAALDPQRSRRGGDGRLAAGRLAGLAAVVRGDRRGEPSGVPSHDGPRGRRDGPGRRGPLAGLRTAYRTP